MVEPGLRDAATLRRRYKRMHKNVLKSMNAYGVVFSILATLSYTGFLQTPEPLDHSPSSISPSPSPSPSDTTFTSIWQKLFFVFSGSSFFSSVCGLLFFANTSFSPIMVLDFEGSNTDEDEDQVNILAIVLSMFVYINIFFALSLTSSVAAYAFAGLATVQSKLSERIPIILTCVIGGFIYIQALITSLRQALNLWQGSIKKDARLWETLKQRTLFGKVFTWYLDYCGGVLSEKSVIPVKNPQTDVDLQQREDLSERSAVPVENPQRNEELQQRENQPSGSLSSRS